MPDEPVDVDAEAIGSAGALVLVEDSLVGDAARFDVVVESQNFGRGGVREV